MTVSVWSSRVVGADVVGPGESICNTDIGNIASYTVQPDDAGSVIHNNAVVTVRTQEAEPREFQGTATSAVAVDLLRGLLGEKRDIRICHRTSSGTELNPLDPQNPNPYNPQNHNESSLIRGGHGNHEGPIWFPGIEGKWGDIIEPFEQSDGTQNPGYNWPEGAAILNNDCEIPGPPPTTTSTTSTTSSTTTTTRPRPRLDDVAAHDVADDDSGAVNPNARTSTWTDDVAAARAASTSSIDGVDPGSATHSTTETGPPPATSTPPSRRHDPEDHTWPQRFVGTAHCRSATEPSPATMSTDANHHDRRRPRPRRRRRPTGSPTTTSSTTTSTTVDLDLNHVHDDDDRAGRRPRPRRRRRPSRTRPRRRPRRRRPTPRPRPTTTTSTTTTPTDHDHDHDDDRPTTTTDRPSTTTTTEPDRRPRPSTTTTTDPDRRPRPRRRRRRRPRPRRRRRRPSRTRRPRPRRRRRRPTTTDRLVDHDDDRAGLVDHRRRRRRRRSRTATTIARPRQRPSQGRRRALIPPPPGITFTFTNDPSVPRRSRRHGGVLVLWREHE